MPLANVENGDVPADRLISVAPGCRVAREAGPSLALLYRGLAGGDGSGSEASQEAGTGDEHDGATRMVPAPAGAVNGHGQTVVTRRASNAPGLSCGPQAPARHSNDEAPLFHLRPENDGGPGACGVWSGDRRLATAAVAVKHESVSSVLRVRLIQPLECSRRDAADIVAAVTGHARELLVCHVELETIDPIVRHEARRAGLDGDLRQPLRGTIEDLVAPSVARDQEPADAEALARTVGRLAGVTVAVRAPSGWLARLARGAVAGFAEMVKLTVHARGGRQGFAIAVPNRADVLPESLALAVDTVLGVRRRFGPAIDHLKMVSFDHASHGLKAGHHAGEASTNLGIIHLNAWYALAGELEERRQPHPVPPPNYQYVGSELPRYSSLEQTTAHELWHQIEAAFEARDYRGSIELRRRLGAHFGVETLEHAILGRDPDSPPAWSAAQEQLVAEVSDYGGTLPGEATAEMFALWWCPIMPPSPAVERFRELVEARFPPPA